MSKIEDRTIKKYTHNYIRIVSGAPFDPCFLTELCDDRGMPPERVKQVCLDEVPEMDFSRVPIDPLAREGEAFGVFIDLWTIAGDGEQKYLYYKRDWSRLDRTIFCTFKLRSIEDREAIIRIIRRQWALAMEFPRYDASMWQKLLSFVQR